MGYFNNYENKIYVMNDIEIETTWYIYLNSHLYMQVTMSAQIVKHVMQNILAIVILETSTYLELGTYTQSF